MNLLFIYMNKYFKFMVLLLMMILNYSIIYQYDIYIVWLVMEINSILFTILLIYEKNKYINFIYFLTQMLSSLLILLSTVMIYYSTLFPWMYLFEFSIFIKLGIIPNFKWMYYICNYISYNMLTILLTLTKFIPFMFLSIMNSNSLMMFTIFFFSAMISSILNFKDMNMNMILFYSSLFHSFFLILTLNNNSLFIIYFIFYSLSIFILCMFLNSTMNNNNNSKNYFNKNILIMLSLNYLGILPFMGFFYKWMLIQMFSDSYTLFLLMILLMSSLLFIFYFFRMIYWFMIISKTNYKNISKLLKFKNNFMFTLFLPLSGSLMYMLFNF